MCATDTHVLMTSMCSWVCSGTQQLQWIFCDTRTAVLTKGHALSEMSPCDAGSQAAEQRPLLTPQLAEQLRLAVETQVGVEEKDAIDAQVAGPTVQTLLRWLQTGAVSGGAQGTLLMEYPLIGQGVHGSPAM